MMIDKLDRFHKSKVGYAVFAVIELAIAYGFFSLAVDRGSLWWYLLTLVFFVGFLQNVIHLIGSFFRYGRRQASRAR